MWYAKLIYSSGEEDLVEDGAGFATEDAARDAALYEISCYKQAAEDL